MEFNSPYKQLNRKVNTWCNYTQRLDTYGCGCQHDCSYCYAKSLLSFRGMWDSKKPKKSNLLSIKNTLRKLPKSSVLRLGSMTDCFQPIEKTERITFETIKMLNYYKLNYLIVTKNSVVSNPEYLNIYDKKLSHFQITITSTDNSKSIKYEKASLPTERIKSIETLYNLGFDITLRLSPFIESNIDFEILNNINCDKILIEFLKVNHNVKKWFDIDYSDYTLAFGGYYNLQLHKKIQLLKNITGFNQLSVGEFVKEHHIYFSENVNFNKNDCCNLNISLLNQINNTQLKLF